VERDAHTGLPDWLDPPEREPDRDRHRNWRRGPSRAQPGRRGDILNAALVLFNANGFTRTGVQDIAYEARASVGSVYHHFENKEDIAAALFVEGMREYQRGLFAALGPHHESAEKAIKGLVRHHLQWVERNRELARFLLTSRTPEVAAASDAELSRMNGAVFRQVREMLDRWVEAGEVRQLPISLLHSIVLGPAQEFARHWVTGGVKESIDKAEPVLAEAAWKAVKA
jgi:AcrR family transcriptional regulator